MSVAATALPGWAGSVTGGDIFITAGWRQLAGSHIEPRRQGLAG